MFNLNDSECIDAEKMLSHIRPIYGYNFKKYLKDIHRELNTQHLTKLKFYEFFKGSFLISDKLFNVIDQDSDGILGQTEFENGILYILTGDYCTLIKLTFDFCDFNKDGQMYYSDLKLILRYYLEYSKKIENEDRIDNLLNCINLNNKDSMCFQEYKDTIEKHNSDIFIILIIILIRNISIDTNIINCYNFLENSDNSIKYETHMEKTLINSFMNKNILTGSYPKIRAPSVEINYFLNDKLYDYMQSFVIKKINNEKNDRIEMSHNPQLELSGSLMDQSTKVEPIQKNNAKFNPFSNFFQNVNLNNEYICNQIKKSESQKTSIADYSSLLDESTLASLEKGLAIKKSWLSDELKSNMSNKIFNEIYVNDQSYSKLIQSNHISQNNQSISNYSKIYNDRPFDNSHLDFSIPEEIPYLDLNPHLLNVHYENIIYKYDSLNDKMVKMHLELRDKQLLYFKNSSKNKFKGMHFLQNFESLNEKFINKNNFKIIDDIKYYCFCLFILGKKREYYIDDFQIFKEWVENIKKVLNMKSVNENYELISLIYEGKTESILKAKKLSNNELVSIKIYPKSNAEEFKNKSNMLIIEKEILNYCKHRNIIKLIDYFEDLENVYIITEYSENGNLMKFMDSNRSKISFNTLKNIAYQICEAVCYLHENGIIHRDIKPQNIVVNNINNPTTKLIDFNLSALNGHKKSIKDTFGTLQYVAPEILQKKSYTENVDIWSLGVTLYYLFYGKLPFPDESSVVKFVKSKTTSFEFPNVNKVDSKENTLLQEFLTLFLQKEPSDRKTIFEIMEHKFLTKN